MRGSAPGFEFALRHASHLALHAAWQGASGDGVCANACHRKAADRGARIAAIILCFNLSLYLLSKTRFVISAYYLHAFTHSLYSFWQRFAITPQTKLDSLSASFIHASYFALHTALQSVWANVCHTKAVAKSARITAGILYFIFNLRLFPKRQSPQRREINKTSPRMSRKPFSAAV
jgi:hypothetical protein